MLVGPWGHAGLMLAAPARAEAPPGGTSAQTLPAWWAGAGLPGYSPDAALAGGMPWTFAGLTAGSWQLRDPIAPVGPPNPGVAEAQAPAAWYDSAAVIVGEDAAWLGHGASLATAQGFVHAPGGRKPRAMFTLTNGTHGLDRNAIFITRGEGNSYLRAGATGDRRGGVGDLGDAGDHLWTVSGGTMRGSNAFDAGFTQRGMDENQNVGVGETASGKTGHAGWSGRLGGDSLALRIARALDRRDVYPINTLASLVRREAQENDAELQMWHRRGERALALRLALREARVVRLSGTPEDFPPRQEWSTRSVWLSARARQPLAGGALDLQVGAGRDRSVGSSQLVPGASWRVAQGTRSVRLFAERALVPIWSELEADAAPFTQDTWLAGFETAAGRADATEGSLVLLAGRTGSRATQWRYPVRGEGLLRGWRRDVEAYRFLLLQGTASARWRALALDATGYGLARPRATGQPRVDPGLGARAGFEGAFRAFAGDLGVRLRVEGAYVGARETDTRLVNDVMLPSYTTLVLRATFTFGDATIAVRGSGLAGERHPESWVDQSQGPDYVLARDSGPQWRTEVTWPLFN